MDSEENKTPQPDSKDVAEFNEILKTILKSRTSDFVRPSLLGKLDPDPSNQYLGLLSQLNLFQNSPNLTKEQMKDIMSDALKEAIRVGDVSNIDPANVQEVAGSQLLIISGYYKSVLRQAQQSFLAALIAAFVGFLFFIAAVSFLLLERPASISYISLISGALVEVISGVNFYLYARASEQLVTFHVRLDRTQNILLANSVCENLEGEIKQQTRSELVRMIASIPVITGQAQTRKRRGKDPNKAQALNEER
jgi:hypothetical protein